VQLADAGHTLGPPGYRDGSFIAGRGVCFVRRVDYELHRK